MLPRSCRLFPFAFLLTELVLDPIRPHSPSPLQGVAINFVTNDDERLLQDIQRFYNTVIEVRHRGSSRSRAAICKHLFRHWSARGCVGGQCIRAASAAQRQRHRSLCPPT